MLFEFTSTELFSQWDERLKTVFNRGFWGGYYLGQRFSIPLDVIIRPSDKLYKLKRTEKVDLQNHT